MVKIDSHDKTLGNKQWIDLLLSEICWCQKFSHQMIWKKDVQLPLLDMSSLPVKNKDAFSHTNIYIQWKALLFNFIFKLKAPKEWKATNKEAYMWNYILKNKETILSFFLPRILENLYLNMTIKTPKLLMGELQEHVISAEVW